jgi:hypothetical protein
MSYLKILAVVFVVILGFLSGLHALLVFSGYPASAFHPTEIATISGALLYEYAPGLANALFADYSVKLGELDVRLAVAYRTYPNEKAAMFGMAGVFVSLFMSALVATSFRRFFRKPVEGQPENEEHPEPVETAPELLKIGTREIPYEYEAEHLIAVGATGVGKSQSIRQAVNLSRKRKNPALVLDIGGELTSRLYRPEKDFIIAAHDARSVDWSPLAEMEGDYDAERLAAAMIPLGNGGDSEEWARMSRIYAEAVLISVFDRDSDQKPATNKRLAAQLSSADPKELLAVVGEDSPVSGLLREGNERMLGSVIGTATSKSSSLRALPPEGGTNGWSIKKWLSRVCDVNRTDDERDSWLFVPIAHEYGDAGKPLASMIAGFVVQSFLAMGESERRFWFFCDELGQYPKVNEISKALTLGRKYGLCAVHAVQTIDQLEMHYGRNGSGELLSCYGTKVIYRQGDYKGAKWAQDESGQHQIRRFVTNISKSESGSGASLNMSHSESTQEQISTESTLLDSEFMSLKKLQAWVKTAAYPGEVYLANIPYIDIGPQKEPAFVPRKRAPKLKTASVKDPGSVERTERENIRLPKYSDSDVDDLPDIFNPKETATNEAEFEPTEAPEVLQKKDRSEVRRDAMIAGIEIAAGGAKDPDEEPENSEENGRDKGDKAAALRSALARYGRE